MRKTIERSRLLKAMRDCPTPILEATECIKKAFQEFGREVYVSWSGGRCSSVVLFLALQVDPKVNVVFNDTGVEFPETYEFVRKISKEWNVNLTVLKPKTTFWACVKEYGFPMLRGQYKDDSKSKDGRPMCCQLLKEEPLSRAGIKCTITGIRAVESRMRMFAIAQRGQYYYAKTLKRWRYHPIAFWSTLELLEFVKAHNIPTNKVYELGQERCGCWPCTGYIGWRESLARTHPKMYRFLARYKGEPTLWEYTDNETCKQFLEVSV